MKHIPAVQNANLLQYHRRTYMYFTGEVSCYHVLLAQT